MQELEAEFEKLPSEKPQQTRFLRSQQDLKAKMEAAAAAAEAGEGGNDEDEDEEPEEAVDPFDLMTPVEIISKLPKDFYEKIVRFIAPEQLVLLHSLFLTLAISSLTTLMKSCRQMQS